MKTVTQHNSAVFERIKRSLDPAYSYLIFEKESAPIDKEVFQNIVNKISHLNLGIFESKIHHDKNLGLALMVVKVDPERTDKILQTVMNIGIPDDITFYSYGSRYSYGRRI